MTSSLMEKLLLKKIDELIEIIIDLSSSLQKAELRAQAIRKIDELMPLVLHFIQGDKSLVQPMLYQLIMEKMPDLRIISSFANLHEELNSIILEITNNIDTKYFINPIPEMEQANKIVNKIIDIPDVTDNTDNTTGINYTDSIEITNNTDITINSDIINKSENSYRGNNFYNHQQSLKTFILRTFPAQNVHFNYRIGGELLDAYLPNLKTAYIVARENRNNTRLNYFCKKQGVRLIVVPPEAENNYLMFKRINKFKYL